MISTQSTQSLFWTPSMLKSFKQDWNIPFLFTGSNWVHWLDSVYSQGISCTTKQETILDKDITTLISVASEGCQVTLHDAYKKLASKKIYQENDNNIENEQINSQILAFQKLREMQQLLTIQQLEKLKKIKELEEKHKM